MKNLCSYIFVIFIIFGQTNALGNNTTLFDTPKAIINFTIKNANYKPINNNESKNISKSTSQTFFESATKGLSKATLTSASKIKFNKRKEVKQFIKEMSKKHNFNKKDLNDLFGKFHTSSEILGYISKPYEQSNWGKYSKNFLNKNRINQGLEFWEKNSKALTMAENQYGVPAHIIIAIIGVETFYGKHKGNYPVVESLLTLSFDYPKRASFFKKELEEFLLLTREKNLDPLELKGSYAGAMGIPQFISSSYRNFAVNFKDNPSKKVDIINDISTAIASIANYFKLHGWQPKQPIVHNAWVKGKAYKSFISSITEKPKYSLQLLTNNKIYPNANLKKTDKFSLIELDTGKNKEYWLGAENFYVITRYNHSYNYAMAVYQLGMEIKKLKEKHDGNKK